MVRSAHERGRPDIKPAHNFLFAILGDDGDRAANLAGRAGITRQSMGEVIRELVDLGILEMAPDPDDGRAKIVRYTAGGQAVRERGLPAPAGAGEGVRGGVRRRLRSDPGGARAGGRPAGRAGSGIADPRRLLAELPQPPLRGLVVRDPVEVTTWGAPPISPRPPGPTYVAPGRSAVAAISSGQAPCAAGWETALMLASRIVAMPPLERPYWPLAARWVPANPGCAASARTGSSLARARRSSS